MQQAPPLLSVPLGFSKDPTSPDFTPLTPSAGSFGPLRSSELQPTGDAWQTLSIGLSPEIGLSKWPVRMHSRWQGSLSLLSKSPALCAPNCRATSPRPRVGSPSSEGLGSCLGLQCDSAQSQGLEDGPGPSPQARATSWAAGKEAPCYIVICKTYIFGHRDEQNIFFIDISPLSTFPGSQLPKLLEFLKCQE